ncbi:conserved hypothetical protein [Theileria equi strain WA]|uniref:Signal peptide-containing protein n=1 Tax=Theileria equi strain WA TaxID=1537102 RepID=L1LGF0_THEEQ|nr:conserved hypothetical protein [Theileria equi strain WA]EKX74320.1 conserved hypothetical protein [Theileria equi strain WA]|eukprot:XP_004833772.1 conserved hypothetical protein [Theileria equi strain WA]
MPIKEFILGILISSLLALLYNPCYSLENFGHYVTITPVFLQTSTESKGHALQGGSKGDVTHSDKVRPEKEKEPNGPQNEKKNEPQHLETHKTLTHTEPIHEHGQKSHKELDDHEDPNHMDHDEGQHLEHEEDMDVHVHHSDGTSEHQIEDDHKAGDETLDKQDKKEKLVKELADNRPGEVTEQTKTVVEHKQDITDKKNEDVTGILEDKTPKYEEQTTEEIKHRDEKKKTEDATLAPTHETVHVKKEKTKSETLEQENHALEKIESHDNSRADSLVKVHEQHEEHAKERTPEVEKTHNTGLQPHEHNRELSIRKLDSTCPIDCNPSCQSMLGGKTQCIKEGENDRTCAPLNKLDSFDCDDGYIPCSIPIISTVQTFTLDKNNDETGELDIEGKNLNKCIGLIIADRNSVCSKVSLPADLEHTSNVLNPKYDISISENKLTFSNLHIVPGDYKICIYQQYDTSLSKLSICRYIVMFLEWIGLYRSDNKIKTLYSLQVGTLTVTN